MRKMPQRKFLYERSVAKTFAKHQILEYRGKAEERLRLVCRSASVF